MNDNDRYEKGLARFREVFGRDPLPGQNADFIRITLEHLFGEIWTRPQLSVHERELITLSALAMMRTERELKGHMGAALQLILETALELRTPAEQGSTGVAAVPALAA